MANGKSLEDIRAEQVNKIIDSLKGPNKGSGGISDFIVDHVANTGGFSARIAASIAAAGQNSVVSYKTERERQFRRTAEAIYDKSVALAG
jgi:hypothetical protein